ncbi:MAG: ABC transporter substrate-binding protein [Arenimonas sp.]|nr:ABC transporter substrate-binding protein [Arenimonas sp.]
MNERVIPILKPLGVLAIAAGAAILLAIVASQARFSTDPVPGAPLTDQYGNTLTLDQPAERIVTIPIPAASMLIAVDGGAERLVGTHPMSKSALQDGILGTFFPDARSIPSNVVGQGFMPNVEALLTLEPDLVLQWGHQGSGIVEPLRAAGLPVVLLRYGSEEDALGWLTLMGRITGKTERAQRLIDWRATAVEEVRQAVAGVAAAQRPRVLFFQRYRSELRVAGTGTYSDFYIDLAGGVNPAAEGKGWLTVEPERILAWNPEVILLNGVEDGLSPAEVYANPLFADVAAVKNRRVYQLPLGGYRWDPPSHESPLSWKWLAMLLHPDHATWPLRDEIADAYAWIYGQRPDSTQIDGVLRLDAHVDAARYADLFAARQVVR